MPSATDITNERRTFKCRYCSFFTRFRTQIINHLDDEHNIFVTECPKCKKNFRTEYKLRHHLRHTKEHTTLDINPNEYLLQHVDFQIEKPSFICPQCSTVFPSYAELDTHLTTHHALFDKSTFHMCRYCSFTFKTSLKLGRHIAIKHFQVKYIEQSSNNSVIITYGNQQSESKTANDENNNNNYCNLCNMKFIRSKDHKLHAQIVHNKKLDDKPANEGRMCHVCGRILKNNRSFMKHMSMIHNMSEKGHQLLECPVCEKRFARPNVLEKHVFVHQTWVGENETSQSGMESNNQS
ncbi:unnamed protein product [Didymodactylos carnosus]|uniref:C2H2-type domain-containing protein n=1 Tax=Didymodactylos carnosus TaxID=1234261 RepID=A0A8S2FG50_9BILA|nr:unnamed protein product [Didymodactylos carnosus]CAF4249250.1 unnamed protein product [Didymodactylos carnosus]